LTAALPLLVRSFPSTGFHLLSGSHVFVTKVVVRLS